MTWNTPRTDWQPNEIVTADDLNAIGQNLSTLHAPAWAVSDVDHGADFAGSPSSFTNVDPDSNINTNQLGLRVTTNGGPLLVTFVGAVTHINISSGSIFFNIAVDGVDVAGDDGILRVTLRNGEAYNASFSYWLTGVAAGTHDIHLRWKTIGGNGVLWAGAGTSNADLHPQFAVREVS